MLLVFLPLFIGFYPDAQLKGKIVILLPLAFQTVELRVDRLNCSQTGCSIRDIVLMHDGRQPRAVAQTVIFAVGLYAGSKDCFQSAGRSQDHLQRSKYTFSLNHLGYSIALDGRLRK